MKTVDELMRLADEYANAAVVQVNEAAFWESDTSADPARAALRSALEEVVANDRRYRWLESHTVATGTSRFVQRSGSIFLAEAVDAAMQQAPEQEG